jgi:hypothetical protein
MKTFEFPQDTNHVCPICGTQQQGDAVMIGISGTQDGYNYEAALTHLECLLDGALLFNDEHVIVVSAKFDYINKK